jgi:hypothetical protein
MRHAGPVRSRHRVTSLTRELFIVRRSDVTITADGPVVRNPEVGMVKYRPQPGRGYIGSAAGRARCRV